MVSVAQIIYPPPTKHGWQEWTLLNAQHHAAIEAALLQVKGIQAQKFRLWPVTEADFTDWLQQHQLAHELFNQALGISGADLSDLDRKDKTKFDDWMFRHSIQHRSAASILGLSIL